jgi:hypothetical protein
MAQKQDQRELYLLIEGDGWAISAPVDPKLGAEARAFAARINAAGSRQEAQTPSSTTQPEDAGQAGPSPDPLDQLNRLAQLKDDGVITSEEFEAKKRVLLDRL